MRAAVTAVLMGCWTVMASLAGSPTLTAAMAAVGIIATVAVLGNED